MRTVAVETIVALIPLRQVTKLCRADRYRFARRRWPRQEAVDVVGWVSGGR